MKKLYTFVLALSCLFVTSAQAQDCQSTIKLVLFNISSGGHFSGQTVELISTKTSLEYKQTSDAKGEVTFILPCDERFEVTISNYASKEEIVTPARANSSSTRTYSYEADMIQKRKDFAMDDTQKAAVDKAMASLPDTTFVKGSTMPTPRIMENYSSLDITLIGLDSKPLVAEEIVFTGTNRNKSIKAQTSAAGNVRVYLPKGDLYTINFKYHDAYQIKEVEYSKGTSQIRINIMYMGTKEFLRRKKAEEERMAEEKREAAIALAGGGHEYNRDKVLETVMGRNNWTNKLLITDVSYEMLSYALKLADWYRSNLKSDQTTQFVLYHNGKQRLGSESGSAFHLVSPEYDSLVKLINYVHEGAGLEKAKYDLKGLIDGGGISQTYDDVILFVDKDASLHDYAYFKNLKAPVHVVLCVDQRVANAQHLTIAWKTKGSVHTISGDFNDIGKLKEGDNFVLEGTKYKIMGGEFVLI